MDPFSKPNRISAITNTEKPSPSLKRNPKAGEGSKSLSDLVQEADELTNTVAKLRISHSDPGVSSLGDSPRKHLKIPSKVEGHKNLGLKISEHEPIGLDIDVAPPTTKRRAAEDESESPPTKKT